MNVPVYDRHGVQVHHGGCLAVMRSLPAASVDAVITDPPYGLAEHKPAVVAKALTAWLSGDREHVPDQKGFMGRRWDGFVPPPAAWDECLRVLKPGGWLLAFAGTRTVDLMGMSIRLAGFEFRDSIGAALMAWVHGQGFPKGKAQLKPAWEPIVVARKPASGPWLNIDGCRTRTANPADEEAYRAKCASVVGLDSNRNGAAYGEWTRTRPDSASADGRWPTNVVLSHAPDCEQVGTRKIRTGTAVNRNRSEDNATSWYGTRKSQTGDDVAYAAPDGTEEIPAFECQAGCPVADLDAQTADLKGAVTVRRNLRGQEQNAHGIYGSRTRNASEDVTYGDSGSASRFFPTFRWEAKAPSSERPMVNGKAHETVKPLALMRWMVRLVCAPGGTVLDCFAGSGTTGQAARAEGMRAVLIEQDVDHIDKIRARLDARPKTTATEAKVAADEPMDLLDLLDGTAS